MRGATFHSEPCHNKKFHVARKRRWWGRRLHWPVVLMGRDFFDLRLGRRRRDFTEWISTQAVIFRFLRGSIFSRCNWGFSTASNW